MLDARAVDIDAPDRTHAGDRFERGMGLLAGAEQAERRGVLARDRIDRGAGGGADAHAGELELVHQRQRLGGLDAVEDDDAPVERLRVLVQPAVDLGARRLDDLRAGAHAGDAVGGDRADMDIGEVFALGVGMLREVAHARPVDRDAVGEIAEGDPHRLDAVRHRQQPLHVVVGDDDGHARCFLGPALSRNQAPRLERLCCAPLGNLRLRRQRTGAGTV